jgi:F0F1-type ATP synthase membrane subunit b/b'
MTTTKKESKDTAVSAMASIEKKLEELSLHKDEIINTIIDRFSTEIAELHTRLTTSQPKKKSSTKTADKKETSPVQAWLNDQYTKDNNSVIEKIVKLHAKELFDKIKIKDNKKISKGMAQTRIKKIMDEIDKNDALKDAFDKVTKEIDDDSETETKATESGAESD